MEILGFLILSFVAMAMIFWPIWSQNRSAQATVPEVSDPLIVERSSAHPADGRGQAGVAQDEVIHNEVVREIYQQRIAELAAEVEDEELRAQVQSDLGAVLLTEYQDEAEAAMTDLGNADKSVNKILPGGLSQASAVAKRSGLTAWGLVIALAGVTLLVFISVADFGVNKIRGAEVVLQLSAENQQTQIKNWQELLSERVTTKPADSKSWYLLGHAELKLGNYNEAASAFATTNDLVDDDVNVQIYWLQARYLAARGALDNVSRKLATDLLQQRPNLPVVLEILALDAFRNGKPGQAITLLNRAISGSNDPVQQATLGAALSQIRSNLNAAPARVVVNVAASAAVPRGTTLFVIARPVGGGMPFAVVKRPGLMLPTTVHLDDLVSMSGTRLLSQAEQFEVVVRLSHSGSAMAATGDWQYFSDVLQLSNQPGSEISIDALLVPPG